LRVGPRIIARRYYGLPETGDHAMSAESDRRFERILLFCHQVPTMEILDNNPEGRVGNLTTTMHMVRDGVGGAYLREVLGIPVADVAFNLLSETFGKDVQTEVRPNFLSADTLVVSTTRFPLDDIPGQRRLRWIARSENFVERALEKAHRRFFEYCDRERITLGPAVTNEVRRCAYDPDRSDNPLDYWTVIFRTIGGWDVRWRGTPKKYKEREDLSRENKRRSHWPRSTTTVGYALYAPSLGDAGAAGLLNVFGASGTPTMVACYLLAREFGDKLRQMIQSRVHRLMMIEFSIDFLDGRLPLTLGNLTYSTARIVVDVGFP
jgi:hypothetical protein